MDWHGRLAADSGRMAKDQTAKLFPAGPSQAVRLPQESRFDGDAAPGGGDSSTKLKGVHVRRTTATPDSVGRFLVVSLVHFDFR